MPLTDTAIRNAKPGEKPVSPCCIPRLAPLVFVRSGELRKAEWVSTRRK